MFAQSWMLSLNIFGGGVGEYASKRYRSNQMPARRRSALQEKSDNPNLTGGEIFKVNVLLKLNMVRSRALKPKLSWPR